MEISIKEIGELTENWAKLSNLKLLLDIKDEIDIKLLNIAELPKEEVDYHCSKAKADAYQSVIEIIVGKIEELSNKNKI